MAKDYSSMTIDQLNRQFTAQTFSQMDRSDKQGLLQAYVDARCKEDGLPPVHVEMAFLEGPTGGHYKPGSNTIVMNEYLLTGGYMNEGTAYMVNDSNYRSLEVLLHEYQHAWQNAVVNGKVQATDEQLARALEANQHTTSPVLNGTAKGSQYISPDGGTPYSKQLYFLNPSEQNAYKTSQAKMQEILAGMPDDAAKQSYLNNLNTRGWEARLARAQEMLGRYSNNVAKDMETVLTNAHFGEKQPVNQNFRTLVESEMAATYSHLHQNQNRNDLQSAPAHALVGFDAAQQKGGAAPVMDNGSPSAAAPSNDLDAFDRSQQQAPDTRDLGDHDKGSPTIDDGGLSAANDNSNDNDNDNGMDNSM